MTLFTRLLSGLVAASGVLILTATGGLQPLTHLEYRLRFQLRGPMAWDDRITLIAIDEASLAELGAFPWPRTRYAELLKRLQAAPPSVISFDLLFTDSAPGDAELAAAMAQHQAIILASAWDHQGQPLDPVTPLARAAMGRGHIYQPREADGLARTVLPQLQGQPALGIATANALALREQVLQRPPLERPLWVNWPGPATTLSTVSFVDVLQGRVEASRFHQQIIIIGATAAGLDQLSTPFDINPPASGVHLHGAVLDNILQQRWLRPVPVPWWLLLGLGPLLALILGRSWPQRLLQLGILTLAWILLALVLLTHGWWIAVVEPVLLLGLTVVTWGLSQALQDDRRIRQYVMSLWHTYASALLLPPQESGKPSVADSASLEQLMTLAEQLGRSQAIQAAIARSLPMGLLAADSDGTIWFCNPLASAWLGVTTGQSVASRLKPWLTPAQWQAVQQGETVAPQEIQDGEHWFALYLEPLRLNHESAELSESIGFVLLLDDISYRKRMELELRRLNLTLEEQVQQRTRQLQALNRDLRGEVNQRQRIQDRLAYEAHHDSLTQLPNRRLFLWHLQQRISTADCPFAVLFLDCDRFKLVNDTFGHWMGDELLKAVAAVLLASVGPTDIVARCGGDEFTILLTDSAATADAIARCQQIRQRFNAPLTVRQHQFFTNVSIGIVLSHPRYRQPEEMLRDADTAMYQAKRSGCGYALFELSMHQQVRRALQIETELRLAITQQQLCLYYQPIVILEQQQLAGCEALLRWHHPQRGLISPSEFMPIAEETGLIIDLGRWVLQAACCQMRRWQIQGLFDQEAVISVNLSMVQLWQPDLLDQIDEALALAQLPSHCLKLELTETAIMSNAEGAIQLIQQLQQRGIKVSIDDFGTGYSSLSYLQQFPVDMLKIDQQFIHDIQYSSRQLGILEIITRLASHLQMQVIAEGIETTSQLQLLQQLGCRFGQGYLFSHPLAATELSHLLQHADALKQHL